MLDVTRTKIADKKQEYEVGVAAYEKLRCTGKRSDEKDKDHRHR
jgi:hypothetical protein